MLQVGKLLGVIGLVLVIASCGQVKNLTAKNKYLANEFNGDRLLIWDLPDNEIIHRWSLTDNGFSEWGEYSPDGKYLATTSDGGNELVLWDAQTIQEIRRFRNDGVFAFTPDSKYLVSDSDSGGLTLWDVGTGNAITSYKVPDHPHQIVFSPDGKQVLCIGFFAGPLIFETQTGKLVQSFSNVGYGFPFHNAFLNFSIYRTLDHKERTCLMELSTRKKICTLGTELEHFKYISIALSPDETRLVSCPNFTEKQSKIILWDAKAGKKIFDLTGPGWQRVYLVFSPDGTKVAAGARGVRVWDVKTGKLLHQLDWEEKLLTRSLSFSPDGKNLLIGRDDWRNP